MDNFLKEADYALEVLDNHSNSSSKDESSVLMRKAVSKSNEVNHMGEFVLRHCIGAGFHY